MVAGFVGGLPGSFKVSEAVSALMGGTFLMPKGVGVSQHSNIFAG